MINNDFVFGKNNNNEMKKKYILKDKCAIFPKK